MKILLAAQQSPHRYPIAGYAFWAPYLRNGLTEAGHEVIEPDGLDWPRALVISPAAELKSWRGQTWSVFAKAARDHRPDVVLTYLFPEQIDVSAVKEIRALGIPFVNFYCDHIRQFRQLPEEFGCFDLNWVPEKRALPWYKARGWQALHAPMPAWIRQEARHLRDETSGPALFIGTRDSLREDLLGRAIARGAEIDICGHDWLAPLTSPATTPAKTALADEAVANSPQTAAGRNAGTSETIVRQIKLLREAGWRVLYHKWQYKRGEGQFAAQTRSRIRPAPDSVEAFIAALQQAPVFIGINRYPSFHYAFHKPDTYSRLRDIEAPMAGACYLTEWADDLPDWYEIGREVETYQNALELQAKLADLNQPAAGERRKQLRRAAQSKALNELSIPVTISKIIRRLGLEPR